MRQERVFRCIKDCLGGHVEVALDSTPESLGMDSIDEIEFVMALEEDFNIEIPDHEADKWETVADVVAAINRATGV